MDRIGSAEQTLRDHVTLDQRLRRRFFQHQRSTNVIVAALDVVGDSTLALRAYLAGDGQGEAYLRIYGLLQAIAIQQDALAHLSHELQAPHTPDSADAAALADARRTRIILAGHPTLTQGRRKETAAASAPALTAGGVDDGRDQRDWSHQISRFTMTGRVLEVLSFAADGSRHHRTIDLHSVVTEHVAAIATWLEAINGQLATDVLAHRKVFRDEKLGDLIFPEALGDGLQLLAQEAAAGELKLSRLTLADLRDGLRDLKVRLAKRETPLNRLAFVELEVKDLEHALGELERFAAREAHCMPPATAAIVAREVGRNVETLRAICREIDETYASENARP